MVGVALGWRLFGGRVRDLKSALDKSDELLRNHQSTVIKALESIKLKLQSIDELAITTTAGISKIRGDIGEIGDAQALANEPNAASKADLSNQASMKELWTAIRDKLEMAAAESSLDGRTRAKYARIDRRRYRDLVEAMAMDGALGANTAEYRQALEIWSRYRSGRNTPSAADSTAMTQLARKLAAVPA